MKLAILDAQALNPGDLSWDCFKEFAQITVYPSTRQEEVSSHIADSDAVLLNKVVISESDFASCPNLKYIGVLATGYNVINEKAVKKAHITVTNIPSYSTDAVAQHVFALILHFSNQIALHNESVLNGDWIKSPKFCYWNTPLFELSGKTLGIFGYGNIGKKVESIAKAFGMNVIICPHHKMEGEKFVSFETLLEKSDILTLHAPLTEETENLINEKTISKMKNASYLINTARGALVNENDVKNALETKKLSGYACDVLVEEPMSKDCPLFKVKNAVITPHLAWAPLETRKRCMDIAFDNLKNWILGKPTNVIY